MFNLFKTNKKKKKSISLDNLYWGKKALNLNINSYYSHQKGVDLQWFEGNNLIQYCQRRPYCIDFEHKSETRPPLHEN